jgi:hypothetical protein
LRDPQEGKQDARLLAMDDRYAQFLIAVGDLCAVAAIAGLSVETCTADGARTVGVPGSILRTQGGGQVEHSGYARTFRLDDQYVNLDEIVQCTVWAPTER